MRKPQLTFRIVPAQLEDLDEMLEIEHLCFTAPWSRQVFFEELHHNPARMFLARHEATGQIAAFIDYWAVHDEIHVLNVATHPAYQRQGLGRRLMDHAIQDGLKNGARLVTLEVRLSNTPARKLYRQLGFVEAGIRPAYYENREDAVVMNLDLDKLRTS